MVGTLFVTGDRLTKPRSRIRAQNEERILDAALDIFAEFGFKGASMAQISEQSGISKANIHYYFKRKSDIYIAVMQRTLNIWLGPLADLDPNGDPKEELTKYIALKMEFSRKYPAASRLFASEMLHQAPILKNYLETDLRALVSRKTSVIQSWIKDDKLIDVDPYHLLFLIWSSTQHYADFMPQIKAVTERNMTKKDFEAAAKSLTQIIFGGILPDGT